MHKDFEEFWAAGRAYRRVTPARWPFVFRGALPLVGLLVVVLFGVTRFASEWIEHEARQAIERDLAVEGLAWAELDVSGQQVRIGGTAPSPDEGDRALTAARAAECGTWLGPRTCAVSVTGDFSADAGASADEEAAGPAETPAPNSSDALARACEERFAGVLAEEAIEFTSGSAALTASAALVLDRIAREAEGCPGTIRIEGHTDRTGDPESNRELSLARALSVREALAVRGIPLERMTAQGFGADRPIAGNDTAAGRAANRRIELHVETETN